LISLVFLVLYGSLNRSALESISLPLLNHRDAYHSKNFPEYSEITVALNITFFPDEEDSLNIFFSANQILQVDKKFSF